MEYIISRGSPPPGDLYEDETYCTRGLCAHPSCWASHVRQTRGFKRYVSSTAGSSSEWRSLADEDSGDEGLATLKVLNMLDEYGSSSKDLYPSEHRGLPAHKQKSKLSVNRRGSKPKTPTVSATLDKAREFEKMFEQAQRDSSVKPVEVQEVFDLEELSQNWDSTFIPKPVYVWVPGKGKRKGRKKNMKSSADKRASVPDAGSMRDITNDMLPRGYAQGKAPNSQSTEKANIPRSRSPIPTGGQPYQNVGQTPKDRMRFQVIMNELKDLPRPFVIEVLEKARNMESKEDVLMLMERYLKTMRKSDWELSMVTGKVLQQQRLNTRILQHSEKLPAVTSSKVYKLDEAQYDDSMDKDITAIPADIMHASMGGSNKYKALPAIGEPRKAKKNTVRVHVSTTTQESVKPFQYKKKADMEFCLGPTRSLSLSRPVSEGTTHSARQPTIPAGDMSVLYDQQSVERNANNNANPGSARKRAAVDPTHAESTGSSVLPKAPAGTPYSPNTPYKDRQGPESKLEGLNCSPEGAEKLRLAYTAYPNLSRTFALEVIQEMAVVDEFAPNQSRLGGDADFTAKSVIEARAIGSPVTRRVVSANAPRLHTDPSKRVRSASASMALFDRSSIGQQDQEVLAGSQAGRVTSSRLEIVSSTSNWPNVDEEALLREQTNAELDRIASAAGASKHSRDSRRSAALSNSAREADVSVRTIVVDMPALKRHENSPAPPPPSPEPANKLVKAKTDESNSNADVTERHAETGATIGDAVPDADTLPNRTICEGPADGNATLSNNDQVTNEGAEVMSELPTGSQPNTVLPSKDNSPSSNEKTVTTPSTEQTSAVVESSNGAKPIDPELDHVCADQSEAREEIDQSQLQTELEEKLAIDLELNIDRNNTGDPLSLVPDNIYKEMDLEREITLSVLPPSVLDTPEISALNNKQPLPKISDSKPTEIAASPDVAAVMNQDDQGGLSGQ